MLKEKLSKEQWCYLLGMDEPELYHSIQDVLRWWRLKQEWQGKKGYGHLKLSRKY